MLKPFRVSDLAIAQEEPHPNPDLAKGRGPEERGWTRLYTGAYTVKSE
ncbi:hypothetical protein [Oscillatoria sp. HE19RPO]|nr:hypothetical protein [Oscillatoria sp. HE19RPO]